MRRIAVVVAVVMALAVGALPCAAQWTQGEFQSDGKPVQENHCIPTGAGPFPAVIMLHGAGPRGMADNAFEDFCSKLADHGYYTEFIEYYSQTSPAMAGDTRSMVHDFPTWLNEVHSGIAALKKRNRSLKFLDTYLKGDPN
jgi:dienelactone hydrolase